MKKNQLFIAIAAMAAIISFTASCKKDKVIITNTGNNVKAKSLNVLNMFKNKAPQKQTFTLNITTGGMVTGAKGTMVYFYASSLLDKNGNKVTGNVDVELTEFMSKSDMLFSGVTVTSGDQLLESGGMFELRVKQGGQELTLDPTSLINITVPSTVSDMDPMDFWNGNDNQNKDNNLVDWKKVDSAKVNRVRDSQQGGGFKNGFNMMQFNYFKFGFCNIDREWGKFKNKCSKFRIKMPNGCVDSNSTALLLFKNYNCCAWCYWMTDEDRISTGYQLPAGETLKVLIYKKTGPGENDLEMSLQEVVLGDDTEVVFTSTTACTLAQLEAAIEAL